MNYVKASKTRRFIAYLIDILLVYGLVVFFLWITVPSIFNYVYQILFNNSTLIPSIDLVSIFRFVILALIFIIFYFAIIPVLLRGQTIGKRMLMIRVIKTDGTEAQFVNFFLRDIVGKILFDFTSFGISWIISTLLLFGKRGTTIYDTLAKTVVINDKGEKL